MDFVQHVAAQSQRIALPLPWGEVVWHVWGDVAQRAPTPLVLLHGGSGSWLHWVRNVRHLAQRRTVWALDMPGFGESAVPPHVRDADGLAPCLGEVLQRTFGAQAVDVVGFSFGGLTAGLWAAENAQAMRTLVLVGVPGLGLMQNHLPMRGMLPEMNKAQQREVHRHNLNTMMLAEPDSITDAVLDMQEANVARDRLRRRRIARSDVLAQAQHRWLCPVHGIWGARDALYEGTLAQVPKVLHTLASFQTIEGAGHWVAYERPDAFHQALDALLP